MVFNSLGGGHTHTCTRTHADFVDKNAFKKPGMYRPKAKKGSSVTVLQVSPLLAATFTSKITEPPLLKPVDPFYCLQCKPIGYDKIGGIYSGQ